jgi:hypothetical protein
VAANTTAAIATPTGAVKMVAGMWRATDDIEKQAPKRMMMVPKHLLKCIYVRCVPSRQ